MKKIFLIFTVLFTCALPVSGFGDGNTDDTEIILTLVEEPSPDSASTPTQPESEPTTTASEKSNTAEPELIKISGIVIDATSENEQPIGGVRIKYDGGKKDKDGNIKYALHQTGNNGRFVIDIVPGSTITLTHKMYQNMTTTYSVATKDVEIKMSPTAAHERENSMANKMLGAAGIGATGIGGMMLMQGLAEQKADNNAQEQMRAYLSTFMCRYGDGRAKGGESDIELPGANALLPLYAEYVTLANETKAMKTELDLKPGIESESILDNATSGLYDDENSGKTSGAFASLARALQNPDGEDAKKWAQQTEKASKNVKTGAITAGAGAVGGLVGHITESAVYKKKAEKGTEDSDDESEDKKNGLSEA